MTNAASYEATGQALPASPEHAASFHRGRVAGAAWEFGEGPGLSHYADADEGFRAGFADFCEGLELDETEDSRFEEELNAVLDMAA